MEGVPQAQELPEVTADDPAGAVPGREAHCVQLRQQFGLRADLAWVRGVDAHGDAGGMVLGIPLTPDERNDIEGRSRRVLPVIAALSEAALDSAAGVWVDQRARGVLHVLLAQPTPADLETVQTLTASVPVTIDFVARTTATLERLQQLVRDQIDRDPELRGAWIDLGIAVSDNVVRLRLARGTDPAAVQRLRAAAGLHGVDIQYTDHRWST